MPQTSAATGCGYSLAPAWAPGQRKGVTARRAASLPPEAAYPICCGPATGSVNYKSSDGRAQPQRAARRLNPRLTGIDGSLLETRPAESDEPAESAGKARQGRSAVSINYLPRSRALRHSWTCHTERGGAYCPFKKNQLLLHSLASTSLAKEEEAAVKPEWREGAKLQLCRKAPRPCRTCQTSSPASSLQTLVLPSVADLATVYSLQALHGGSVPNN